MTRPGPMPAWLITTLEADGIYDGTTRLSRTAKPRRCPKCWAPVLAGLDEFSRPTWLNADPTTSAGELLAVIAGQPTYALDCGQLYARDRWHIGGRPADAHRVHTPHVCHGPPPPTNAKFTTRWTRPDHNQPPPF